MAAGRRKSQDPSDAHGFELHVARRNLLLWLRANDEGARALLAKERIREIAAPIMKRRPEEERSVRFDDDSLPTDEQVLQAVILLVYWGHLERHTGSKAACSSKPCKVEAVGMALQELQGQRLADESSEAATIGGFARVVAVVEREVDGALSEGGLASELASYAKRWDEHVGHFRPEMAPPNPWEGCIAALEVLRLTAAAARQAEGEVRAGFTVAPAARVVTAANGRPEALLLRAICQHLRSGRFKDREIADLVLPAASERLDLGPSRAWRIRKQRKKADARTLKGWSTEPRNE